MNGYSAFNSLLPYASVRYHPWYEMGKEVGKGMARGGNKLTDTAIRSSGLKPGRHSDGGGLYLNVTATGSKSWLFMWTVNGKRREMGMGPYPEIGLANARKLATNCREVVASGRDPIAERRAKEAEPPAEPTFSECCDQFLASMEGSWRNEKHRAQWRMTLGPAYCKAIQEMRVSAIGTDEVLKVLTPAWTKRPATAAKLRGRIERVLDFATARGWRKGENPALWRGHLKSILPARQKIAHNHHAAMPYKAVPAFLVRVRAAGTMPAHMLEFVILTAARSGEARGAFWSEIDMGEALWTVPASRMKTGKGHRVPLSGRAMEILGGLHEVRTSDLIFPGRISGRPLSAMSMDLLLRRLKADVTVHGFRSAFRDWCGEETSFPREVAEQALAHSVGDAVERAYRRGDALEKRRALMEAWSAFLASKPAGQPADTPDPPDGAAPP